MGAAFARPLRSHVSTRHDSSLPPLARPDPRHARRLRHARRRQLLLRGGGVAARAAARSAAPHRPPAHRRRDAEPLRERHGPADRPADGRGAASVAVPRRPRPVHQRLQRARRAGVRQHGADRAGEQLGGARRRHRARDRARRGASRHEAALEVDRAQRRRRGGAGAGPRHRGAVGRADRGAGRVRQVLPQRRARRRPPRRAVHGRGGLQPRGPRAAARAARTAGAGRGRRGLVPVAPALVRARPERPRAGAADARRRAPRRRRLRGRPAPGAATSVGRWMGPVGSRQWQRASVWREGQRRGAPGISATGEPPRGGGLAPSHWPLSYASLRSRWPK